MVTIVDYPRVLYFSEKGIEALKKVKMNAILFFVLAVLIQAFPSTYIDITEYAVKYAINAVIVAALLTVVIGIIYIVMRTLGSAVGFKQYLGGMSAIVFLVSFVSIAIAFALINLGIAIGSSMVLTLVQGGVIVYYLFVVFAWSAERLAGIDKPKGAIGGIISIALIYVFHLILSTLP